MNYYNPYFYSIPSAAMQAPKVGLFSRLFGGNLTFGSIVNGTQKTLGFINQVIPVVKQARPMINNAKTMFKVMNEFKKTDKPKTSFTDKVNKTVNNIKNNVNTNININTPEKEETVDTQNVLSEGPTFFI